MYKTIEMIPRDGMGPEIMAKAIKAFKKEAYEPTNA